MSKPRRALPKRSNKPVSLRQTDNTNQGNGRLGASEAGESVSIVTLSDMSTPGTGRLSALSADSHVVKIDVEGLETAALPGARKWAVCSSVVEHITIEISDATRVNQA